MNMDQVIARIKAKISLKAEDVAKDNGGRKKTELTDYLFTAGLVNGMRQAVDIIDSELKAIQKESGED